MQCPSCKKKIPMSFECRHCGTEIVRRSGSVSGGSISHTAPALMAPPPQDLAAPMEPPSMDRAPMPTEAPAMYSAPLSVEEPPMEDGPRLVDAPPKPAAASGMNIGAPEMADDDPYEDQDMRMPQSAYTDAPTLASPFARLAAHIVDSLIIFGLYLPAILVMAVVGGPESAISSVAAVTTMSALLGVAIYQLVLLSRDGQTLGKKVMKVRVVRYDDGGNPGFGRAVGLRLFVNGLLFITLIYPLVNVLFILGGEHRCIHDLIAGTKVVATY